MLYRPVSVSKKINEQQALRLNYTKRLVRPYICDLGPNTNASDPKNKVSGNPQLQPEIAHQAEITYSLAVPGFFISSSLFCKQKDNAISDLHLQEFS